MRISLRIEVDPHETSDLEEAVISYEVTTLSVEAYQDALSTVLAKFDEASDLEFGYTVQTGDEEEGEEDGEEEPEGDEEPSQVCHPSEGNSL